MNGEIDVRLTESMREEFDRRLDQVMAAMPPRVHELLDEVTLYIEDHPPPALLRQLGLRRRDQLCGLYTGVPLTERHVELSGVLSDVITIYREGILSLATDRQGRLDEGELLEQIRITVLHELGHHHGLDEQELADLGY